MSFDTDRRARMYIANKPDPSTVIHEVFHQFARELDPSGTQALLDAYVAARNVERADKGLPAMRRQTRWTRMAEEWAASEFEKYVATGTAPSGMLQGLFNAYGQWGKDAGLGEVNPALHAIFHRFGEIPDSQKYVFNADEQRIWGAGRTAVNLGEEQAHTTHYYRRGRAWLERSINHPYLGLYPASYMWGKVFPELTRFLLKKPFGLDAPLGGLVLARNVYNSIQLSIQSDTDLQDFIESNPDTLRILNMLVPGIPWNIPVSMPLWARRAVEAQQENERRAGTSTDPKNLDLFGTLKESAEGSFGLLRDLSTVSKVAQEFSQGTDADLTPEEMLLRDRNQRRQQTIETEQQRRRDLAAQGFVPQSSQGRAVSQETSQPKY